MLGVTPHALTTHAARDNGYLAEIRRPRTEVLERRYLLPLDDFFQPVALDAVVRGLNALGASPRDIIAIMQALKAAGALRAEIIIL